VTVPDPAGWAVGWYADYEGWIVLRVYPTESAARTYVRQTVLLLPWENRRPWQVRPFTWGDDLADSGDPPWTMVET
jgi:hypothetical protein